MQESDSVGGKILQTSFWLLSQESSNLVLAFIFSLIAFRRLGPEIFGLVTLTQSILNLSNLGTFNLERALIRLLPNFREQNKFDSAKRTILITYVTKIGLACILALLLFLIAPHIGDYYHQPALIPALRVGSLSLLMAALSELGAEACLGYIHPEIRALTTTIRRLVEILGLIIVSSISKEAAGVVLVLAVADTIAAIIYTIATWRLIKRDPVSNEIIPTKELSKDIIKFTFPLLGARITEVGGREIGKLLLAQLASPVALGYYSIARLAGERIMSLLSQAPLASVPVISPLASSDLIRTLRKSTKKRTENIKINESIQELYRFQLLGGGGIGIILFSAAPIIVRILGGDLFSPAIPAVRFTGITVTLWAGVASLHALFLIWDQTVGIFYLNGILIISTIIFYGLLANSLGATGAAIGDSLGQIITLAAALFIVKRWYKFNARKSIKTTFLLVVPALLIATPSIWFINTSITLVGALLTLITYTSYVLSLNILNPSIWLKLKRRNIKPHWLDSLKNLTASGMYYYHSLILRVKYRISNQQR